MYRNVFTYYRENNFVAYVNDANLKKAMYMMGMKLTKQTEEKVREGKDELTGSMTYNFWYAYRLTLENEIQTQKILKMKKLQEEVEAKISGGK